MTKFLILILASKTFAIGPGSSPTGLSLGAAVSCADGSSSNVDSGTLYIDCTNNRVGAGTTGPQTPLDVAGASQFGSGATKSTFTATGALNLASGAALTATGAAGNIISGSSITTSGGVFGVGGALTGTTSMSVPTGLLVTGPLASAILPSTVAYTSVANTFTAAQTINANVIGNSSITTNGGIFGTTLGAGLGSATPKTVIDIVGDAQFGSGATKSTVTTAGSLTLASAALFRAGGPALTVPGTVVINSTGAGGGDSIARIQDSGGSVQWIFLNNGQLRAARADVQLIVQNTDDGSDNQGIQIGHANTSRGALTEYFGNEHANAGLLRHQAGNVTGGVMTFTTNNTERVRIDYAGLVGIGSVAPATKLHMSSGTLTIDGNTQLVLNLGGTGRAWSRTKAQIDTLSAGAAGEWIFCSNCNTNGEICVSTGTAASQWHQVGRTSTIGCGSNE